MSFSNELGVDLLTGSLSVERHETNSAPHTEVYPENNIPLMQAFDVNARAFIAHANSGRLSVRYLAMTSQRHRVYALHLPSSLALLFFFAVHVSCEPSLRRKAIKLHRHTAHNPAGHG